MDGRRTKIVCTVGPASSGPSMLVRMLRAGMDVARLNFSHGTHEEHRHLFRTIRAAAAKAGKTVAILQDLQGPKIRVGALPKDGVVLRKGELLHLTTVHQDYVADGPITVTYPHLHKDVHAGHRILFDDGTIEGEVERVRGKTIAVRIVVPGTLRSHKGINLPDSAVGAEAFTEKDRDDLLFGIELGVDWVVLSFVKDADDVKTGRQVALAAARARGVRPPKIMAKVERRTALQHLAEIIEAADGVLLGRGDLGVEIPPEEVPVVQKDVVDACRRAGKPVIVATQMLNSMSDNPRATRAETSDVANAVFDHADAVMLSAESATGRYPAVAVQAMAAVIREAEKSRYDDIHQCELVLPDVPTAMAQAVHVLAASGLIAAAVVVAGRGDVARKIGIYRPGVPLLAVCEDAAHARQMALHAGMHPLVLAGEPGTFIPRLLAKIHRERLLGRNAAVAVVTQNGPRAALEITRL